MLRSIFKITHEFNYPLRAFHFDAEYVDQTSVEFQKKNTFAKTEQ